MLEALGLVVGGAILCIFLRCKDYSAEPLAQVEGETPHLSRAASDLRH